MYCQNIIFFNILQYHVLIRPTDKPYDLQSMTQLLMRLTKRIFCWLYFASFAMIAALPWIQNLTVSGIVPPHKYTLCWREMVSMVVGFCEGHPPNKECGKWGTTPPYIESQCRYLIAYPNIEPHLSLLHLKVKQKNLIECKMQNLKNSKSHCASLQRITPAGLRDQIVSCGGLYTLWDRWEIFPCGVWWPLRGDFSHTLLHVTLHYIPSLHITPL